MALHRVNGWRVRRSRIVGPVLHRQTNCNFSAAAHGIFFLLGSTEHSVLNKEAAMSA